MLKIKQSPPPSQNNRLISNGYSESGRTMLETLGVIIILIVLTIGGIKGFGWMRANAVANNLLDQVMDMAVSRQNELLGRNWRRPEENDKYTKDGVHGISVSVENGISGNLKDVFWVTLGTSDFGVDKKVCETLLEKKEQLQNTKLPLLAITVGSVLVTNGTPECHDQNIINFIFPKNAQKNGGTPNIIINPVIGPEDEPQNCDARLCPVGAECSGSKITCLPGYKMVHDDNCSLINCVACTNNTYNTSRDTTNSECTECPDGQITTDHRSCHCAADGTACSVGGFSGYVEDCRCVQCTKDSHCHGKCEVCRGGLCQELPDGSHCSDCTFPTPCWNDQLQQCIVCDGSCLKDADCDNNKTCNKNTHLCEDTPIPPCVTDNDCNTCEVCSDGTCVSEPDCTPCTDNTSCPAGQTCDTTNNKCIDNPQCGENATLVGNTCQCNAGYYGDGQTCTQCTVPLTSDVGATTANDCYCPMGYYLPQKNNTTDCFECPNGSTSDTKNATICTCTIPNSHWTIYDEDYGTWGDCRCNAGYWGNLDLTDGSCTACPQNMTSDIENNFSENQCYCLPNFVVIQGSCALCPTDSTLVYIENARYCNCTAPEKMWNYATNQCETVCDINATVLDKFILHPQYAACVCNNGYYGDGKISGTGCTSCGEGDGWTTLGGRCFCDYTTHYTNTALSECWSCPANSTLTRTSNSDVYNSCACTESEKVWIRQTNTCESCPSGIKSILLDDGTYTCVSLTELNIDQTHTYWIASGLGDKSGFTYNEAERICSAYQKTLFDPLCHPAASAEHSPEGEPSVINNSYYKITNAYYCNTNYFCTPAPYSCYGETIDSSCHQNQLVASSWIAGIPEGFWWVKTTSSTACSSNKAFYVYPIDASFLNAGDIEVSFGGYAFHVNSGPKSSDMRVLCKNY